MPQRYEQDGADVQESLSGWAKQQEAALAEDQDTCKGIIAVRVLWARTETSPTRTHSATTLEAMLISSLGTEKQHGLKLGVLSSWVQGSRMV